MSDAVNVFILFCFSLQTFPEDLADLSPDACVRLDSLDVYISPIIIFNAGVSDAKFRQNVKDLAR